MAEEQKKSINKDLILREQLAIERTKMANDRTFLSFLRTGLYFSIAGMTINELVDLPYGTAAEAVFWILAVVVLIAGVVKYITARKKINESRKHIGNYLLEAVDEDF
jgi:putative membrane protein